MSKDWCESGHSVENDTAKKDNHYEGSPTEGEARATRYVKDRIGSCEAGGVSKKFCLLDLPAPSHGHHNEGRSMTHMSKCSTRVVAFNNLGEDLSLEVRKTSSPTRARGKRPVPPSTSGQFFCYGFALLPWGSNDLCFGDAARPPPLDGLDKKLEHYLRRVSFVLH
jgi:hypothetical protein